MAQFATGKFHCRQLNANLAGVIFGCTNETLGECESGLIFGLPKNHLTYVQNIKAGMAIFLFNYSTRELYGVYKAVSKGRLDLNPHGWTKGTTKRTNFPAQVKVEVFKKGQPLKEYKFKLAIKNNYINKTHFMFELDHGQVAHLCKLYKAAVPVKAPTIFNKVKTLTSSSNQTVGPASNRNTNQKSRKQNKGPKKTQRAQMIADGVVCGPLRPRSVGTANGLIMRAQSSAGINRVLNTPLEVVKKDTVKDILRTFLEKQDLKNEATVIDSNNDVLCLFGGIDEDQYFFKMEYLDQSLWKNGSHIPIQGFLNGKAVCINRNIYILGSGNDCSKRSICSVELLKEGDKTWRSVSSMKKARSSFGAMAFQDRILITGGQSCQRDVNSCEVYDPHKDIWTFAPSLPSCRSEMSLSTDDGIVYACGGSHEGTSLSSMEHLDPRTGLWIKLPQMHESRKHHASVSWNGKIWVIGGQSNICGKYLDTVEVYDPRNQIWEKGASIQSPSAHHTAEIIQNEVFIIGGALCPQKCSFRGIYKYNQLNDIWTEEFPAGSTGYRAHHASCVLVSKS